MTKVLTHAKVCAEEESHVAQQYGSDFFLCHRLRQEPTAAGDIIIA